MEKSKVDIVSCVFDGCDCVIPHKKVTRKSLKEPDGKWRNYYRCPEHGYKLLGYNLRCAGCKELFFSEYVKSHRCDKCKAIYYREERRANSQKNRAEKKAAELPAIPPIIKRELRGSCQHGDYCVRREFETKERFNCHNCPRFEPLIFNVMDYVTGVGDFTKAQEYFSDNRS